MFNTQADIFFEAPTKNRKPPNTFGVLYLLRRDVITCLGVDPSSGTPTSYRALWPGAMGILAGVDLVAKFWRGSDERGEVGKRFKKFVNKYFQPIPAGDEEVLYQLRNSLLHSFGLYSEDKGKVYRFHLSDQRGSQQTPLVHHNPPDVYQVDILTLHDQFERAIMQYQNDVESNVKLQQNFNLMFPKYGAIKIK